MDLLWNMLLLLAGVDVHNNIMPHLLRSVCPAFSGLPWGKGEEVGGGGGGGGCMVCGIKNPIWKKRLAVFYNPYVCSLSERFTGHVFRSQYGEKLNLQEPILPHSPPPYPSPTSSSWVNSPPPTYTQTGSGQWNGILT